MEGDRRISDNTFGDKNTFIQGNATINRPAKRSQRRGENDVLKRLYTSRYQDQKDRNPPRVPGTCDWFVSHKHFQTWNESNSSALLWVSADPGCGKSVLVRHLVDSVIQATKSRTVCYFFFKDDFLNQKNITSALSCILRQIFIQKPSLLSEEILKKFKSGGATFDTSFSELWQTLIQVAENKNAGEIVCLLDAIDECEDQSGQGRSGLLKALCTLYGTENRRRSNLKFLLTSRPYVGIYRSLQPVRVPGLPVIHLSGESEDEIKKISLEINIYIDARVEDIGERLHLSDGQCDLLLERLKSVPNRTYLWVYLVLDFIESSINVNNLMIIEATLDIPTTVNEAYERILSKSFNSRQARKALHIIVAALRPLTLREMKFALALDTGDQQSYDDLGLVSDDRFRETLRNICGLCVVVVDSKVYLLHQTVKEFLVEGDTVQVIGCDGGSYEWNNSLEPQESHRILAEICIWHLITGLNTAYGSLAQHNWREIFLDYSAKHWASHFRQTTTETQSMMTDLVLMICDANSNCCKMWFSSYWTTTNTEFPEGFTTLMIASYFGLNFAVRSLLTISDVELDTQDGTYQRSALSWAARNGFHSVAKLLLGGISYKVGIFKLPVKKRPEVDLQDKYGRTPLTYAVWNGDVTLVQSLITAGARADLRDELSGTPLSYALYNGKIQIIDLLAKKKRGVDIENDVNRLLLSAAAKGHEEVMSLLLKTNRANVERKDRDGETPLMIAVNKDNNRILKLLLEAGADANARDQSGKTALIKASEHGNDIIVNLLLEAGADANARDQSGKTALIKASEHGNDIIVNLLIEAGADVNTALLNASRYCNEAAVELLLKVKPDVNGHDEDGETALMHASQTSDETIAKLLVEAGADVHAYDRDGKTALIWASYIGHGATVKLLLEAGADVNAVDEGGRTALKLASRFRHEAIVKLLLEAGANPVIKGSDGQPH